MNGSCSTNIQLKQYQLDISDYLRKHPKQKGLIIELGTGTGKTLVGVETAKTLLKSKRVRNVVVITPRSLLENFRKNMRMCFSRDSELDDFEVTTYQSFSKIADEVNSKTLLIIDEAHNLRNISSQRAQIILDATTQAAHVLLLTATPFVNRINDIAMLARMITPEKEWHKYPTTEKAFVELYGYNPDLYVKAFHHLIAFYQGDQSAKPRVTQHIMKVPLSAKQLKSIQVIRKQHLTPNAEAKLREMIRTGILPEGQSMASINAFLTRVRQISNSLLPGDESKCDPKILAMVKQAIAGPKPVIMYSEFKEYGVEKYAICLKRNGVPAREIAIYDGSLSLKLRQQIMQDYDSGIIKFLLLTGAGSEGLSLKATRQNHIEISWNMTRLAQVSGRAVRLDSHLHLPEKERHVDEYYWISTSSDNDPLMAPDMYLLQMALKKQEWINMFEALNFKASIPISNNRFVAIKSKLFKERIVSKTKSSSSRKLVKSKPKKSKSNRAQIKKPKKRKSNQAQTKKLKKSKSNRTQTKKLKKSKSNRAEIKKPNKTKKSKSNRAQLKKIKKPKKSKSNRAQTKKTKKTKSMK